MSHRVYIMLLFNQFPRVYTYGTAILLIGNTTLNSIIKLFLIISDDNIGAVLKVYAFGPRWMWR